MTLRLREREIEETQTEMQIYGRQGHSETTTKNHIDRVVKENDSQRGSK